MSSDQVGAASRASTSSFERANLVVWKFARWTRWRGRVVCNDRGGILLGVYRLDRKSVV